MELKEEEEGEQRGRWERKEELELTEQAARLFGRKAETRFRYVDFDSLQDEKLKFSYLSIG